MFSAYFPVFLRVREVRKILGVFEGCLGIFKKTKEKKDRGNLSPGPRSGESPRLIHLGEAKTGGFPNPGVSHFFGERSRLCRGPFRDLPGLFLAGALNRPRKRKRANRENPRTIPEQIGKIPEKSGKSQNGQKRTKKEGQAQIC